MIKIGTQRVIVNSKFWRQAHSEWWKLNKFELWGKQKEWKLGF